MGRAAITDYTLSNGWPSPTTLYRWAREAEERSHVHLFRQHFGKQNEALEEAAEYRRQARVKTRQENERIERAFLRLCKKRR